MSSWQVRRRTPDVPSARGGRRARWRATATRNDALRRWCDESLSSPGWWVELLGVSHLGVGVVLYRHEIAESFRRGLLDTVDDRGPLATAWWFLVAAPAMWSAGRAMQAVERAEAPARPLTSTGRVLTATGLVGAIVMPRSPFVLLMLTGVASIARGRSQRGRGGRPS